MAEEEVEGEKEEEDLAKEVTVLLAAVQEEGVSVVSLAREREEVGATAVEAAMKKVAAALDAQAEAAHAEAKAVETHAVEAKAEAEAEEEAEEEEEVVTEQAENLHYKRPVRFAYMSVAMFVES